MAEDADEPLPGLTLFITQRTADIGEDEEFEGVDERGPVSIKIPSKFWKVVIANSDSGIQAFAFVLEQDLSGV